MIPLSLEPGLSVVMAAHNEQRVLGRCLESVRTIAAEIVVVDAGSADRTAEIARSFGATVLPETNKLMLNINKNVAIDHARHEWVLLLDPDEHLSDALAGQIARVVAGENDGAVAYWLPRRDIVLGREFSRTRPQLRLFRNGSARFPCEHIHEMVTMVGPAKHLSGALLHEPPESMFEYVHKRNLYSEHRARFLYERGEPFRLRRLILRPPIAFLRTYLRAGFRDGVPGLIEAWSSAYGVMLQDAKLWHFHQTAASEPVDDVLVPTLSSQDPKAR